MDLHDPVVVAELTDPVEAHLIKNELASAGINAIVEGEGQAGLAGVLSLQVVVAAEDEQRAKAVIESKKSGRGKEKMTRDYPTKPPNLHPREEPPRPDHHNRRMHPDHD